METQPASTPSVEPLVPDVFRHGQYTIRRQVFKLLGAAFHIYDPQGQLIGYSKQKAFKLREDIRVYTDESCGQELLTILARQVIDFSASYDVVDAAVGQHVGTLRRKGFTSILRDEWILLDAAGVEIGTVKEDSLALALVRRYMVNLLPQSFHAHVAGQQVAEYRQRFNPLVLKLDVRITPTLDADPRLLLAAGILLAAIEGRQK